MSLFRFESIHGLEAKGKNKKLLKAILFFAISLTHVVIRESVNKPQFLECLHTTEFCSESFAIHFTLFDTHKFVSEPFKMEGWEDMWHPLKKIKAWVVNTLILRPSQLQTPIA